jgi:hypothetical protein
MSANCVAPILSGAQGELVTLTYAVDHRHLEDLLEALASISFPVNPQLYHQPASVSVEFPAYSNSVPEVRAALVRFGFPPDDLKITHAV